MSNAISQQNNAAFATTRWSMITQVFSAAGQDSSVAFGELCMRYRYPVYAYVRRCSHAAPIALDITRSFLDHLCQHFRSGVQPPPKEHFRSYLLMRLHAYLGEDWRVIHDESIDDQDDHAARMELRYVRDSARDESPEQAFQKGFALEVLSRSFQRLQMEAQRTGHGDMYAALVPFLARDPLPGEYDEVARCLRTRPLAVVVALKRLRQRLRELSSEELADTVASAEELATEQHALFSILAEHG